MRIISIWARLANRDILHATVICDNPLYAGFRSLPLASQHLLVDSRRALMREGRADETWPRSTQYRGSENGGEMLAEIRRSDETFRGVAPLDPEQSPEFVSQRLSRKGSGAQRAAINAAIQKAVPPA